MADVQFRFRSDEPVADPAVTVDAFASHEWGQSNAVAVRLEPGDEARDLLPYLARLRLIEVNFPAFTDGRGYSYARVLREAGYVGELRAVGDIGIDQLSNLRRCGFDAIAPEHELNAEDAQAALARWPHAYQATGDGQAAIWVLRHGAKA